MEYKFSDLFKWTSGKPLSPSEGLYPIYGSNGIIGYTNEGKFKNKIILGRVGAYCGSVNYCKTFFNATDNTLVTTCNEEKILYPFAYYLLKSYNLNSYSGGAAQPLITQNVLKHLKCEIPELKIQKKIASILSAYDNLIENNNKRIKLLEEQAQELYKEWFIRFRFPGHENIDFKDTPVGKIPLTFNFIAMNEVIEDYIGGGWGEENYSESFPIEAYVIRGADFPKVTLFDISSCPSRFHKINNYNQRQLKEGEIILEISGGTEEVPVGRTILVTKDLIDRFENGRVICASFCKVLRLKKEIISFIYFYYWMQFLHSSRIIDRYQLQSTGIINFKFEYFLKKGFIILPPMEIMKKFDKKIYPLLSQMNKLSLFNSHLAKQRDLLLPRLMSGKLEVKPD